MTPVIYCHRGTRDFTKLSIDSLRRRSPETEIHLITDSGEKHDGVISHDMNEYFGMAADLACHYEHMSTNPHDFELACLQRWPVILEFVRRHGMQRFVVTDWDVLSFCDYQKEIERYSKYDFTYQNKISIGFSIWNSQAPLEWLVSYIMQSYKCVGHEGHQLARGIWKSFQERGLPGGVSDMAFATRLVLAGGFKCFDTYTVHDGICWDNNMTSLEGWECDDRKAKKLQWVDGNPHCLHTTGGTTRMMVLHFAGHSRGMIKEFYDRGAQ